MLAKVKSAAEISECTTLAQYLALELSKLIRDNPDCPVEDAFIFNRYVR
jgi:hypothetical protein